MGIPKYFRYISQRWPTISQLVNDSVIPEFDNLYLDMNSILHTCTHKDPGADVQSKLSEKEMFVAIFNYIDHLFNVIAPQKVFFMAIDGVAPRAKMNQQRSRRFRSALDQENARKDAIRKGLELPKEDPFDSNCITPGTEFMAKLTEQLKYFISRKITEDARWQDCRVILSGHEVPGEGEHKIMNFIRSLKSEPDFDHNTRHCLYGLDADLIMLGLSTHEPHFALLREEVVFGSRIAHQGSELSEKRFFLLHMSLVREYLKMEMFNGLENPEDVDFERMLDDFILINFFIGNDFLPELPMLLVNDGAVPVILSTYRSFVSQTGEYITDNGIINFQNLRKWIIELSAYQVEKFEDESRDAEWFNKQLDLISTVKGSEDSPEHQQELILSPQQKELVYLVKRPVLDADDQGATIELPDDLSTQDRRFIELVAEQTGFDPDSTFSGHWIWINEPVDLRDRKRILKIYEKAPEASAERQELYDLKFRQWRDRYYSRKFKANATSPKIDEAANNYLNGLQWVLRYYYRGCPSWSWYYHDHYAPMTTELINAITPDFKVEFPPSTPFKPFDQLMAVLPDRSSKLLPTAFRELVLDGTSPIIDFYPHEFNLDKNGKKADWEAVVLIPFIDEERLLGAIRPREKLLSDDERRRNQLGTDLEFVYDPQVSTHYQSPTEGLADIDQCHCIIREPEYPDLPLRFGRLESSKSGTQMLAGFPSLETLPFSWSIEKAGVRIFERESPSESVVLSIQNKTEETISEIRKRLLGERIFVEYPYLREARVTEITTRDSNSFVWTKQLPGLTRQYSNHGMMIGKTEYMVQYELLTGLVKHRDGSYRKEFGGKEGSIPLQLVVENVLEEDLRFKERDTIPIQEEFPLDSKCVLLLNKYFGSPATIKGYTESGNINIETLQLLDRESNFGNQVATKERESIRWLSLAATAQTIGVEPGFLNVFTSNYLFSALGRKVDMGVALRKPLLNLMAEGYARLGPRGSWEFSDKGLAVILAFLQKFRNILTPLHKHRHRPGPPADLFVVLGIKDPHKQDEALKQIQEIRNWQKENLGKINMVPTGNNHLSDHAVSLIEEDTVRKENHKEKVARVAIDGLPRNSLVSPSTAIHQLRRQAFYLGNRVISAINYGAVPLYSKGTVVGVNGASGGASIATLDIVWDHEFPAASYLDGRCKTKRGLTVSAGSVINITSRQLVYVFEGDEPVTVAAESLRTGARQSDKHAFKKASVSSKQRYVPATVHNDWDQAKASNNTPPAPAAHVVHSSNDKKASSPSGPKQTKDSNGARGAKNSKSPASQHPSATASKPRPQVSKAQTPKEPKEPKTPKVPKNASHTRERKAPSEPKKESPKPQKGSSPKGHVKPVATPNEGQQLLNLLKGTKIDDKPEKKSEENISEKEPAKPAEPKNIPDISAKKRPNAAAAVFGAVFNGM